MPVVRVILREGQEKYYHEAQASIHTPDRTLRITRNQDGSPAIKTVSRNFNPSITNTGNMSRTPARARARTPKPIRR